MINEFLDIYEAGLRDAKASLTTTEAIHRIVEKTNLLIRHFNLLEDNTNESIKEFTEKIEYYLNNGMIDEVDKKLDELVENGTIEAIINDNIFDEIKSDIDSLKSANTNHEVNLGCVLRPTTDIISPWELFQDGAHESKGITEAVYNSDGTITLNFDKTYGKIRSFNAFNDEMMKMYGLEVGASTALNYAKLFLISRLIVGTSLTFKQSDQSIAISKAGHIESATWVSGTGVVVKFKNVPKQTPNSVQVTCSNALNLKATCSITGNREITIKFYKANGDLVTDITGDWSCMIDANFTGLVDFNCTSIYDSNVLSSMAIMYSAQMKQD